MRALILLFTFVLTAFTTTSAGAQVEVADAAVKKANELAAAGKLKEAVPKYREALKADPGGHPLAYYNLAEVYRALKQCEKANFMFQLYGSVRGTEQGRKEAAAGLGKCKGNDNPKLTVKVKPDEAQVLINGFLASYGDFGPLALPPGEYKVKVTAVDHEPSTHSVKLKDEAKVVETELEELTFYGKIRVELDVEGARVRVFSGPSDTTEVVHDVETPMAEGVKVEEGRHFVEVTADGYDRWIRNVSVLRDDESVVKVKLTRTKPKEIQ